VAEAVNEVLFLEEGLAGNQRDYYDPRNSFLNEVLDRKRGIPITLSIVYLEVARRLGLNVEGIGLPGHFIVGVLTSSASEAGETPLLVDPFFGGKFLTPADCAARVQQLYGDRVQFSRSMLAPSSRRHILIRLLTNLKVIYANRSDHGRALAAIDRLMILNPGSAQELRDRGAICQQMKFHGQALADLTRYLELAPHAADADSVREAVRALHREAAPAN
jgi:regulator of sirC expression with transglutaminase-like and TPR domain